MHWPGLDGNHPGQTPRVAARACRACWPAAHLLIEDVPGVGQDHPRPMRWRRCSDSPGSACSSPATCCRPTSSVYPYSIAPRRSSSSGRARCSRSCCWPMKSTAPAPARRARCWRAMEERQVSVDGVTHALPEPFLRGRHAESPRAARHVCAAGIAARPLPDADRTGLPRRAPRTRAARRGGPADGAGSHRTGARSPRACSRCSAPRRPCTRPAPCSTTCSSW